MNLVLFSSNRGVFDFNDSLVLLQLHVSRPVLGSRRDCQRLLPLEEDDLIASLSQEARVLLGGRLPLLHGLEVERSIPLDPFYLFLGWCFLIRDEVLGIVRLLGLVKALLLQSSHSCFAQLASVRFNVGLVLLLELLSICLVTLLWL